MGDSNYNGMNDSDGNFHRDSGLQSDLQNQNNNHSNHSSESGGADDVCRDFLRNVCRRGSNCRYRHPDENEAADLGKNIFEVVFCHDYQNRECRRHNCRFIHATKAEEETYRSGGKLPPHLMDKIAKLSAAGPESAYLNQLMVTPDTIPICKDYLKGDCRRGSNRCKFRHLTQAEADMELRGITSPGGMGGDPMRDGPGPRNRGPYGPPMGHGAPGPYGGHPVHHGPTPHNMHGPHGSRHHPQHDPYGPMSRGPMYEPHAPHPVPHGYGPSGHHPNAGPVGPYGAPGHHGPSHAPPHHHPVGHHAANGNGAFGLRHVPRDDGYGPHVPHAGPHAPVYPGPSGAAHPRPYGMMADQDAYDGYGPGLAKRPRGPASGYSESQQQAPGASGAGGSGGPPVGSAPGDQVDPSKGGQTGGVGSSWGVSNEKRGYQSLEEENSALRRRIEDLKKQVADLMATNDFLLEQNAQLRALSKAGQAAAAAAAAVGQSQSVSTVTVPTGVQAVAVATGSGPPVGVTATVELPVVSIGSLSAATGLPVSSIAASLSSVMSTSASTAPLISYPIMATATGIHPALSFATSRD